jgi:16S rRNA (guanine966-N2)-methyltransferase
VDSAAAAIRAVKANLAAVNAEAEVRRADARRFLGSASAAARQYDLVFLDPPYRLARDLGDVLTAALPAVLAPGAAVVAESDRRAPLELDLPIIDERRYGDTLIRIYGP